MGRAATNAWKVRALAKKRMLSSYAAVKVLRMNPQGDEAHPLYPAVVNSRARFGLDGRFVFRLDCFVPVEVVFGRRSLRATRCLGISEPAFQLLTSRMYGRPASLDSIACTGPGLAYVMTRPLELLLHTGFRLLVTFPKA
jgi:hypothetical protein